MLVGTEIATGNADTDVSEFPDKRLETFFKTPKTDNIIPFTIHEYEHTQQKGEGKILVGQALAEGACDFITELVLEAELQHAFLVYGRKQEKHLKARFREEMFATDFSNWLYNGSTTETVGDLGNLWAMPFARPTTTSYGTRKRPSPKSLNWIMPILRL